MRSRSIHASLLIAMITFGTTLAPSQAATFRLQGADFRAGAALPAVHEGKVPSMGCHGKDVALTLYWSGVPAGTRSFALTMVDPDVTQIPGGFVHWVAYNIPAKARTIGPKVRYKYSMGTMGAGVIGYFGPCPPLHAAAHHYHLTLYAVSVAHLAGKHLTRAKLEAALAGRVLGTAKLVGTFRRP
jgi:Raf kinase inhibitor-like YbhB/YbcL family protein